jgi:hypothetical protein
MAKAKAKRKGKKKGRQAKLSKGKKKSRAAKSKGRKGGAKKKAATKKRRAAKRTFAPEPAPAMVSDTTPEVTTFASESTQEQSMAEESPGPEETSYSEINETGRSDSSM